MKNLKSIFTALLLLCCTVATAHHFEVDGIYYNILSLSDKTVGVTYRGSNEASYSNEYNGDVTIPANVTYNSTSYSVTTIGKDAFEHCTSLTNITSLIPADKLFAIDSYVFEEEVKNNSTLYVPAGAKATYAATSGWNEFKNIVELPSTERFDLTVSAANYATLYLDYNATMNEAIEAYNLIVNNPFYHKYANEDVEALNFIFRRVESTSLDPRGR